MIYIFIALIILILSWKFDGIKGSIDDSIYYWLLYFIFVCLVGFSRDIGGDKQNYEYAFSNCVTWADGIKSISNYVGFEFYLGYMPLWSLFIITCKSISSNFIIVQFALAAFINYVFFAFFRKNSTHKFLCVFIYFLYCYYDFNFDILRRGLSIAVGLLAINQYSHGRYLNFYIYSLLSFLIHVAAFVLFLFPLAKRIKFTSRNLYILVGLSVGLYFLISTPLFNAFDRITTLTGITRYNSYIESSLNINGLLLTAIKFIIIPWSVIKCLNDGQGPLYNIIKTYSPIYFAICVFIVPITTLSYCFDYFSPLAILFFVEYIRVCSDNKQLFKRIQCAFIVLLICYRLIGYYNHSYGRYKNYQFFYPYTSIFDDVNTKYRDDMRLDGFSNGGIENKRD